MHVEVHDGTSTIAVSYVPGRVLIPADFPLTPLAEGRSDVRRFSSALRRDIETGLDHAAGEVAIPYVSNGEVGTVDLWIPPPKPFSNSSLEVMWSTITALGFGVPPSLDLQGRLQTHGTRTHSGRPEIFPRLEEVKRTGDLLLADWPSLDTSLYVWRPIDLAGGREDERETLRRARHGIVTSKRVVPNRSARRIGARTPWLSESVANISEKLLAECHRRLMTADLEAIHPHLRTVSLVSATARPRPRHTADPPISTWPHRLRAYFRAVLLALSSLSVLGPTSGPVPLTAIWRLYEHWVAASTLLACSTEVGQPEYVRHGSSQESTWWWARWVLESGELHVLAQPTITSEASPTKPILAPLRSISSDLSPDLLFVFTPTAGSSRYLVVDAKKRLGKRMLASDAASAGSKYIWGIRITDDLGVVPDAMLGVVLASPVPVQPMHHPELAKIQGALMVPTDDFDPTPTVRGWLSRLGAC